jgi:hypothetical protein
MIRPAEMLVLIEWMRAQNADPKHPTEIGIDTRRRAGYGRRSAA